MKKRKAVWHKLYPAVREALDALPLPERARAHPFRHTLCTAILVNGGTIDDASNILGDSHAVTRKDYADYSAECQNRTSPSGHARLLKGTHSRAGH